MPCRNSYFPNQIIERNGKRVAFYANQMEFGCNLTVCLIVSEGVMAYLIGIAARKHFKNLNFKFAFS